MSSSERPARQLRLLDAPRQSDVASPTRTDSFNLVGHFEKCSLGYELTGESWTLRCGILLLTVIFTDQVELADVLVPPQRAGLADQT